MLDRGIVTRGQRLVSAGEMREAADALDAAEAKLAAIDALHYPVTEAEQPTRWCHHDGFSWPCATARILHPKEGTDDVQA